MLLLHIQDKSGLQNYGDTDIGETRNLVEPLVVQVTCLNTTLASTLHQVAADEDLVRVHMTCPAAGFCY